jgi:protocatechuate 3,4-dioxygenase beta subunit
MVRSRRSFLTALATGLGTWGVGLRALGVGRRTERSWRQAPHVEPRAQGLGQFAGGAPPCKADEKPTPAAPQGTEYRPNSPERASLREAGLSGTPLLVTGTISGLTCGPIKRALAEFWHADPNGAYDSTGFRFRGRQFTDTNGRYRLETLVPGAAPGRAPRIHVKVTPPGQRAFTTQLFFPDDPRNKADAAFRPELAMKVIDDAARGKSAVFDIVLNL